MRVESSHPAVAYTMDPPSPALPDPDLTTEPDRELGEDRGIG